MKIIITVNKISGEFRLEMDPTLASNKCVVLGLLEMAKQQYLSMCAEQEAKLVKPAIDLVV